MTLIGSLFVEKYLLFGIWFYIVSSIWNIKQADVSKVLKARLAVSALCYTLALQPN